MVNYCIWQNALSKNFLENLINIGCASMTVNASIFSEIKLILSDVFVTYSPETWHENSLLLGHIPEFDSMAVVTLITTIEEAFEISIEDDEIDAEIFESVKNLCGFVSMKTA